MGRVYDHIELIGPRVLVRPLPDLEFMADGLLVKPDSARHTQNRAVVEKVGPGELLTDGKARRGMPFGAGDLVFYQKFAGTYVTLDDVDRLMLLEDEIQGRVPATFVKLIAHTHADATDIERRVRALDADGTGPTFTATEHLEGEPCLMCHEMATLEERERRARDAKSNLETMREQLRQSRQQNASDSSPTPVPTSGSMDDDGLSSR